MQELYRVLDKVIESDATVLINGENGTGKELVARAIHYNSRRAGERFVVQNCSAFNDNLLDSELFGHKKGAFTGAILDKQGLFEVADSGTFFLDEIRSDATVLINGENGTGKELVARAIHYNSRRAGERFVVQNCSAFNDNLLDSELFGHKKGAFTGAILDKQGLFEVADSGTFFLDEI